MTTLARAVRHFWPIALLVWLVVATIAVSPLTVACLVVLVPFVAASCRRLTGVERRVVLFIVVIAVLSRALVIFGLLLTSDPDQLVSFPFEADGRFLKQRALWMRSLWLGVPIEAEELAWTFQNYGWTSYIYLLAYLQYLFGPAPYAIHFLNACCFVAGMLILHGIVRQAFGPLAGIVALSVTLFLPTLFMWSISALKESVYVLLLSVALLATLRIARASTVRGSVCAAAGFVLAAAALESVRTGALVMVIGAAAAALVGTFVTRRVYVLRLALVLIPLLGWQLTRVPAVSERALVELRVAANRHLGHVRTPGHGYKLLDQRFYSGDAVDTMTAVEARRFVVRAVLSVIVVPLPWQLVSRSELLFLPQQVIWYGLVMLAAIGTIRGLRTDVLVTWCVVGIACAGVAAVASASGNVGTMVRHRDAIVPFVACLSAAGVVSLLQWAAVLKPRRPSGAADELHDDDLLRRVGESSVLVSTSARALAFLRQAWEQTALARALETVGRLDVADHLRLSGVLLFMGTLGQIALSTPDRAWPVVLVRGVILACAVGLVGGGRQLAIAWKEQKRVATSA